MSTKENDLAPSPLTRVVVIERGGTVSHDWKSCEIGADIQFDTAGLEAYCPSNWEPVVYDSFLVAAAVEFCDRVARRPALYWGREFELRIPVHEPEKWRQVVPQLIDTLALLTGDRWHIEFHPRKTQLGEIHQDKFDFPVASSAILPFSDGLDSRIVSALVEREPGVKLIRVRLGTAWEHRKGEADSNPPFAAVPFKVRPRSSSAVESSVRSRGFKFAMLSGVAAHLAKVQEIVVAESGQGSLGPSLVPVGQGYEDYRNHPRFTKKMADFLFALLGSRVHFSFPRIWHTKGETLREYVNLVGGEWKNTRSCWQQNRHASVGGHRRQCGVCAACILRRLSVHAAGQKEAPETYVWEDLRTRTFEEGASADFRHVTEALYEYAIAGTLHMDHLAALSGSASYSASIRRSAFQIAPVLGLPQQDAEAKLCHMLSSHKAEWESFIDSLGPDSFVAKWTVREN